MKYSFAIFFLMAICGAAQASVYTCEDVDGNETTVRHNSTRKEIVLNLKSGRNLCDLVSTDNNFVTWDEMLASAPKKLAYPRHQQKAFQKLPFLTRVHAPAERIWTFASLRAAMLSCVRQVQTTSFFL